MDKEQEEVREGEARGGRRRSRLTRKRRSMRRRRRRNKKHDYHKSLIGCLLEVILKLLGASGGHSMLEFPVDFRIPCEF